jgi:arsenite-transporting ATPase
MSVRTTAGGRVLSVPLPLAAQDDVRLARKGDELVVSVASYRRLLTLPSGLARHRVVGARVRDGELQVRFAEPDPTATMATETLEETL